ncbi:MAG: hypothetical protein KA342_03965 [Aminivibrio sp.]|jgi:hypothetical protein|nr:hypothetical protein [Aminivibrio sp.]
MDPMCFERWRDNQPLQEATEKFSAAAKNFLAVRDSAETDDRIAARKLWQNLSAQYWDVLSALVDAHTEDIPDELIFDDRERLFIDFGYVSDELTPASPSLPGALSPKAAPGLFQYYSFSDFIAEAYSMIMGKPVTPPRNGFSPEGKAVQMRRQLDGLKSRIKIILPVVLAKQGALPSETDHLLSDLQQCLESYTEVSMRTRGYREAQEKEKQQMAVEHHAFIEAEKRVASFLKGNGEDAAGLDENEILKVTGLLESAKNLARNIVFVTQEISKWERRVKKTAAEMEGIPPAVRRRKLKDLLLSKKEYISLTAKSARRDPSQLCQSEKAPLSLDRAAAFVEELTALDPEMLVVARIRMYGIPRVIVVPGQGYGTYDWSDHTLLLPAFPLNNLPEKAAAYALGTFRWDSDEDRVIKNGYELIKENRGKSILDLSSSFYRDYFLWLTKEKKGYRILPRNTHKVFLQMFTPRSPE